MCPRKKNKQEHMPCLVRKLMRQGIHLWTKAEKQTPKNLASEILCSICRWGSRHRTGGFGTGAWLRASGFAVCLGNICRTFLFISTPVSSLMRSCAFLISVRHCSAESCDICLWFSLWFPRSCPSARMALTSSGYLFIHSPVIKKVTLTLCFFRISRIVLVSSFPQGEGRYGMAEIGGFMA